MKCLYCGRARRCSLRSALVNPFCNACLHQRVAHSILKAKLPASEVTPKGSLDDRKVRRG